MGNDWLGRSVAEWDNNLSTRSMENGLVKPDPSEAATETSYPAEEDSVTVHTLVQDDEHLLEDSLAGLTESTTDTSLSIYPGEEKDVEPNIGVEDHIKCESIPHEIGSSKETLESSVGVSDEGLEPHMPEKNLSKNNLAIREGEKSVAAEAIRPSLVKDNENETSGNEGTDMENITGFESVPTESDYRTEVEKEQSSGKEIKNVDEVLTQENNVPDELVTTMEATDPSVVVLHKGSEPGIAEKASEPCIADKASEPGIVEQAIEAGIVEEEFANGKGEVGSTFQDNVADREAVLVRSPDPTGQEGAKVLEPASVVDELLSPVDSPKPTEVEDYKPVEPTTVDDVPTVGDDEKTTIESPGPTILQGDDVSEPASVLDEDSALRTALEDNKDVELSHSDEDSEEEVAAADGPSKVDSSKHIVLRKNRDLEVAPEEVSKDSVVNEEASVKDSTRGAVIMEDDKDLKPPVEEESPSVDDLASTVDVPLSTSAEECKVVDISPADKESSGKESSKEENVSNLEGLPVESSELSLINDDSLEPCHIEKEVSIEDVVTSDLTFPEDEDLKPTPGSTFDKEASIVEPTVVEDGNDSKTAPVDEGFKEGGIADKVASSVDHPKPTAPENDVYLEHAAVQEGSHELHIADAVASSLESLDPDSLEIDKDLDPTLADKVGSKLNVADEVASDLNEEVSKEDAVGKDAASGVDLEEPVALEVDEDLEPALLEGVGSKEENMDNEVAFIAESLEPADTEDDKNLEPVSVDEEVSESVTKDNSAGSESPEPKHLEVDRELEPALLEGVGSKEENMADEVAFTAGSLERATPEDDKNLESVSVDEEVSESVTEDKSSGSESPEPKHLEYDKDVEPAPVDVDKDLEPDHLEEVDFKEENVSDEIPSIAESTQPTGLEDGITLQPVSVDEEVSNEEGVTEDISSGAVSPESKPLEDDKDVDCVDVESPKESVTEEEAFIGASEPMAFGDDKDVEPCPMDAEAFKEREIDEETKKKSSELISLDNDEVSPTTLHQEVSKEESAIEEGVPTSLFPEEIDLKDDKDLKQGPLHEGISNDEVLSTVESPESTVLESDHALKPTPVNEEVSKEEYVKDQVVSKGLYSTRFDHDDSKEESVVHDEPSTLESPEATAVEDDQELRHAPLYEISKETDTDEAGSTVESPEPIVKENEDLQRTPLDEHVVDEPVSKGLNPAHFEHEVSKYENVVDEEVSSLVSHEETTLQDDQEVKLASIDQEIPKETVTDKDAATVESPDPTVEEDDQDLAPILMDAISKEDHLVDGVVSKEFNPTVEYSDLTVEEDDQDMTPIPMDEISNEDHLADGVVSKELNPALVAPEVFKEENVVNEVDSTLESPEETALEDDQELKPVPLDDESFKDETVAYGPASTVESPELTVKEDDQDLEPTPLDEEVSKEEHVLEEVVLTELNPAHLAHEVAKVDNVIDGVDSTLESPEETAQDDDQGLNCPPLDDEISKEETLTDKPASTVESPELTVKEDDQDFMPTSMDEEVSKEEQVDVEVVSKELNPTPLANEVAKEDHEVAKEDNVIDEVDSTLESSQETAQEGDERLKSVPLDEEISKEETVTNEAALTVESPEPTGEEDDQDLMPEEVGLKESSQELTVLVDDEDFQAALLEDVGLNQESLKTERLVDLIPVTEDASVEESKESHRPIKQEETNETPFTTESCAFEPQTSLDPVIGEEISSQEAVQDEMLFPKESSSVALERSVDSGAATETSVPTDSVSKPAPVIESEGRVSQLAETEEIAQEEIETHKIPSVTESVPLETERSVDRLTETEEISQKESETQEITSSAGPIPVELESDGDPLQITEKIVASSIIADSFPVESESKAGSQEESPAHVIPSIPESTFAVAERSTEPVGIDEETPQLEMKADERATTSADSAAVTSKETVDPIISDELISQEARLPDETAVSSNLISHDNNQYMNPAPGDKELPNENDAEDEIAHMSESTEKPPGLEKYINGDILADDKPPIEGTETNAFDEDKHVSSAASDEDKHVRSDTPDEESFQGEKAPSEINLTLRSDHEGGLKERDVKSSFQGAGLDEELLTVDQEAIKEGIVSDEKDSVPEDTAHLETDADSKVLAIKDSATRDYSVAAPIVDDTNLESVKGDEKVPMEVPLAVNGDDVHPSQVDDVPAKEFATEEPAVDKAIDVLCAISSKHLPLEFLAENNITQDTSEDTASTNKEFAETEKDAEAELRETKAIVHDKDLQPNFSSEESSEKDGTKENTELTTEDYKFSADCLADEKLSETEIADMAVGEVKDLEAINASRDVAKNSLPDKGAGTVAAVGANDNDLKIAVTTRERSVDRVAKEAGPSTADAGTAYVDDKEDRSLATDEKKFSGTLVDGKDYASLGITKRQLSLDTIRREANATLATLEAPETDNISADVLPMLGKPLSGEGLAPINVAGPIEGLAKDEAFLANLMASHNRDLNSGNLRRHLDEGHVAAGDTQEDNTTLPLSGPSNDLSSSWVSVSPTKPSEIQSVSGDSVARVYEGSQSSPPTELIDWRIVSEHDLSNPPLKTSQDIDARSNGTKFPFSVVLWCSQSLSSLFGNK